MAKQDSKITYSDGTIVIIKAGQQALVPMPRWPGQLQAQPLPALQEQYVGTAIISTSV